MNPLAIAKTAAGLVASAGAAAIVSNAIKTSIPANSKIIQKITIGVGGFVLSSMVGELATKHVEQNIDNAVAQIRTIKNSVTDQTDPS